MTVVCMLIGYIEPKSKQTSVWKDKMLTISDVN